MALLITPLLCATALAQSEDAGQSFYLEEIVVTARKRQENVQTVPIAITTLPKSLLEDGNFDDMDEFVELVPNVKFSTDQATSNDISIRGSGRQFNAEDPGVAIYRDGVYIAGLLTSFASFYDIERVEILRGPQAGLYGRNAVGGAINVLTARPTHEDFNGYVNARYGSKSRMELRSGVNLPVVSSQLAVRLSGLYIDQDDGFQKNVLRNEAFDALENRSGRVRVLFTPSEALEFLSTIEYFDVDGSAIGTIVRAPNGSEQREGPLTIPPTTPDDLGRLQMNAPFARHTDSMQLVQEVNWDNGIGRVTGIVGYRETALEHTGDTDYSLHDLGYNSYDAEQDALFAELRLSSKSFGGFNFTAGATYLNERLELDQQFRPGGEFGTDLGAWFTTGFVTANPFGIPVGTPIQAFGLTPLGNNGGFIGVFGDSFPVSTDNHQDLESFALFLEASYRINSLELWGNVRYTHDEKRIAFDQRFSNDEAQCPIACPQIFNTFFDINPQFGYPATRTFSRVSPGGGINYFVTDDAMVYAKVVTGFKAGGFNAASASPDLLPFDEERTISYEVGAKTGWWGNALTLNAAAFYQRREDALVPIRDPFMPIISLGVNAGEITNRGLELEARIVPVRSLELALVGGYLDSELTKFEFPEQGIDFSGNVVPKVYKYTLSGIARYTVPLGDDLDLDAYFSYTNGWDGYTNVNNAWELDSSETMDARLGLQGARWKIVGYVDNLSDHRYSGYESYGDTLHTGTLSPGRTYGIQLSYDF